MTLEPRHCLPNDRLAGWCRKHMYWLTHGTAAERPCHVIGKTSMARQAARAISIGVESSVVRGRVSQAANHSGAASCTIWNTVQARTG